MTEIAHGEINIDLNDAGALSGLRRVEAEYESAMARIDRMEAEATVGADISKLEAELRRAKDQVRILEGQRATIEIDGDKKDLDAAIAAARAEVRRLDGEKATIEIETRGARQAVADIEKVKAAEAARAAAEDRYARQRQRVVQQEERSRALAERNAMRENEMRRKAVLDAARETEKVEQLTQAWVKQSKAVEKATLANKRGAFGTEARAELQKAEDFARARLGRIEAELHHFGADVPPVHMRVDTDESFLRRTRFRLTQFANDVGNKLSNIGNVRLNLGPFSGTLRTMVAAVGLLSPMLTSLLGSATALVGVVGTGLAGAMSAAAGTAAGLALNFGGVAASLHPAIADYKIAQQATLAYTKAVDKYGASSKQAKAAQAQMNSVLKTVDPLARQAALGIAKTSQTWQKLTGGAAHRSAGDILAGGFKTLNALMPTLAKNTNDTFGILDRRVTGFERGLRSAGAVKVFDSLGKSANQFLGPALGGLGHLAAAFGHVAEAAARLFAGRAGRGFEQWAKDIDAATQPGAKLDSTIQRLGNHAGDLLHFFSALGHLMVTVLNGGADSGDRMVKSMSAALGRWNQFLKTPQGARSMADFFARSEANVRALYSALAPLIASFVQWSSLLAPFTTGLLKGITAVANLVGGFTKLVGLGGPLAALGATLGVVFAVGKIGAFIGSITRAVSVLRTLIATEGALSALKFVATGGLFAKGATAAAGAAEGAGIAAGAGATAAATSAAAEGVAGLVTAEEAGVAATGGLALGLSGLATGGLALVAAGAIFGAYKLLTMKSSSDKLRDSIKQTREATVTYRNDTAALAGVTVQAGAATASYRKELGDVSTLKHRLSSLDAAGKKGTQEYSTTLQALNQHLAERATAEQNAKKYMQESVVLGGRQIDSQVRLQKSQSDVTKAIEARDKAQKAVDQAQNDPISRSGPLRELAQAQKDLNSALSAQDDALRANSAAESQATVNAFNYQRALRGLVPLAGAAASAIANLAKRAPNLAKSLSTKFPDPKDVGRVATATTGALRSGSSTTITARIIADSKDADEALRRLRAATITPKKLTILQTGGEAAIRVLTAIAGRKLTAKEQRIAQRGGEGVLGLLTRILHQHLPLKTQHVNQVGSEMVLGTLGRVAAYKLPDKKFRVWLLDQASARLGSIIASLAAIHDKSVTVSVRQSVVRLAGLPHASGLHPGGTGHNALVGEGGGPEWRVNPRKGIYEKIMGPTLMRLGRDDAIVPTERRHKNRAFDILGAIAGEIGKGSFAGAGDGLAKALGVPGFAKGKKPKDPHSTPHQLAIARKQARKHIPKPTHLPKARRYSTKGLPELDDVEAAKAAETDQNKYIGLAVDRLVEPSTFLLQTGMDVQTGDPIYSIDNKAVADYAAKVEGIASMYVELGKRIMAVDRAERKAMAALKRIMARATANLKVINDLEDKERGIINSKKTHNEERDNAKARLGVYEDAARAEVATRDNAFNDWTGLHDDNQDIKFRRAEAETEYGKYHADSAAVAGTAAADLESANPKAAYEPPSDPNDLAIAKGAADLALAQADPNNVSGQVSAYQEQLAGYQAKVAAAQAQLNDSDPNNDEQAYQNIAAAQGQVNDINSAITSLQNPNADTGGAGGGGGTAATGATFAEQTMALSSARADLYKTMGSNYSPVWAQSSPAMGPTGFGAYGQNQSAVGGNTVNLQVNNSFPTAPPDPHTWSQGVGWELQAAI